MDIEFIESGRDCSNGTAEEADAAAAAFLLNRRFIIGLCEASRRCHCSCGNIVQRIVRISFARSTRLDHEKMSACDRVRKANPVVGCRSAFQKAYYRRASPARCFI